MPSPFAAAWMTPSWSTLSKSTTTRGVNQYAQKIISTPGKQDGLAWKNADGSWGVPSEKM